MAHERNLTLYRSPQWALVLEIYLAVQAIIMGVVGGLDNGVLAITLRTLHLHYLWMAWFAGLGAAMFITALVEMRCRRLGKDCECIKRFAKLREAFNVGLVAPWGFSVFLYFLSGGGLILVPLISAQALAAVFVIQWENVSAQRLKAEDRRGNARAVVGYNDGVSG